MAGPPPPAPGSLEALLRPAERATVTAPCRLVTPTKRVSAQVVVLEHGSGTSKEAGILVIAPRDPPSHIRVLRTLPITPSVTASLVQTPPSPSTSFFAQSSKPHIDLTLSSGKQKVELRFVAADLAKVQAVIKEIRQKVAASFDTPLSHSWLAFYPEVDVTESTPNASDESLIKAFSDEESDQEDKDRYPNPYRVGFSRAGYVRKRVFAKQDKWSTRTPVSIRLVTYNVNDRMPPPGTKELGPVVGWGAEDIIAVGLQEADLRSSSLFVTQGADRVAAWEKAIYEGLGDQKDEYETIATVQYVGVLLIVLVRSTLRPEVRHVQQSAMGIGLLGFGGNKAGVALRFKVYDSTFCLINSHLAAWAAYLERRRGDYNALRAGLNFPLPTGVNPSLEAYYPSDRNLICDDSDVMFWFGDLNYRIELEDKDIRAMLESKDYSTILRSDQLLTDIEDNKSFIGFTEPLITFPPTFKYVHGSVTLDAKRPPAYTDRILHLARNHPVTSRKYTSHEVLWSDHLPVSSVYSVDVRVLDEQKRMETLVESQRELDQLDELYRPSLTVEVDQLDFGTVSFGRATRRQFTVYNSGRVEATYSFHAPSAGKPICHPWFYPFPSSGVVGSGESVTITVDACVDDEQAPRLTTGSDINDILVLEIKGGKESFVSLRARFAPSIVGLPLEVLPDLPCAIRDLPLADRKRLLLPDDSANVQDGDKLTGNDGNAGEKDGSNGDSQTVSPRRSEASLVVNEAKADSLDTPAAEPTESKATPEKDQSGMVNPDNGEPATSATIEGGVAARVKDVVSPSTRSTPDAPESDQVQPQSNDGGKTIDMSTPEKVTSEKADLKAVDEKAKEDQTKEDQTKDVKAKEPAKDEKRKDEKVANEKATNGEANARDEKTANTATEARTNGPKDNTPDMATSADNTAEKQSHESASAQLPSESRSTSKGTKPPREVWRLLERLMMEGPGTEDLWTGRALESAILDSIDALDTGSPIPANTYASAQALLAILYALPTKLVPTEHRVQCMLVKERDAAYAVVEKLPGVHANVLIGLTSVVRLCQGTDPVDSDTVKALTTAVFGTKPDGLEPFILALLEG